MSLVPNPRDRASALFLPWLLVIAAVVAPVAATETKFWLVDSVDDLLKGTGDGLAVHPDGYLEPARAWRPVVTLEEPVVLAGAASDDGSLVVGTGHPARVYRIRGGDSELLAELEAEQITALLVEPAGTILVATIAPGVLFRIDGERVEEVGRVGEGGFWDLIELDGTVVAAAGPPASLYRVGPRGLERWAELPDSYARCLEVMGDRLVVGTSGKGLLLAVSLDGGVGLLADSRFTEISDVAVAPDGTLWAAALVGEPAPPPVKNGSKGGNGSGSPSAETGTIDLDLPKVNGTTATSELLRLTPEGALVKVHRFTKQVAASVAWSEGGVLVGTGYEGELWRFGERGGTRLASLDALQVVAVVADAGEARWLLTQGPAAVLGPGDEAVSGRYRSDVLRLERPVRFGAVRISPPGTAVKVRFRSGLSQSPDETWLPWSPWLDGSITEVPLPPATSLQWEVELDGAAATVERVEVAYRELNLAPRVESFDVQEPGLVYLNSPPPMGPVIEVDHPDLSGIFSVVGNDLPKPPSTAQGRKYYRVGYRTLSWKAEDPNSDALLFRVEMEDAHGFRLPVRDRLDATQLAVDTTAVPDGLYRFHLMASDAEQNPGEGLETEVASSWIEVDSTPPGIGIEADGDRWLVSVSDASSGVARVDWSRDGAPWVAAASADGVFDGRDEAFVIPRQAGRHLLVVRAIDRHHNRATASVVEEE